VVNELDLDAEAGVASVHRELEGGIEELTDVDLPAVLTIQTGINEPRYASLRGIRQAQRKPLEVNSLDEIGLDETVVESAIERTSMYEPESESDAVLWEGSADDDRRRTRFAPPRERGGRGMTVLAVAEHRRGELRDVSLELVSAGRELADEHGTDLAVAVIGGDVDGFAERLDREGVDTIYTVAEGEEFNHGVYRQAIEQLHQVLDPTALVMPNSVNGLDYAPAIAGALDLPLVTDVIALEGGDPVEVVREQYGGKVEMTYDIDAEQYALTIRPAEWPTAEATGDAAIEAFEAAIDDGALGTTVNGFEEVAGGDVDISDADVLVSVGRGIEEEENIPLVEELAEALGATLSSSRPIVDNGWLPANRQVGQSGKVVTPDVYVAIGISGAVQHVAGMKGADTIIAINTDPNAPIYDIADYGITDDLFEVVPELIEEFGGQAPEV